MARTKLRIGQISGSMPDNAASAFEFAVGTGGSSDDSYLKFVTTNAGEAVELGQKTKIAASKRLELGDSGENIYGDGTDMHIASSNDLNFSVSADFDVDAATLTVDASSAISLDAGAASNLSVSAGDLSLQATAARVVLTGSSGVDSVLIQSDASVLGALHVDATTEASSTSTGALIVDGGAAVAKDLYVGDDLELDSDSAKLGFGADSDVSLTHVHDTGLILNSSRQLQFGDSATHIKQVSDGLLEIEADGAIQLDAPIVDFEDDGVILQFGADDDVTLTHVADTGLLLNAAMELQFRDSGLKVHSTADGQLDIDSDGEIEIAATTNLDMDAANVQIDASSAVSIDAGAASNFSTSAGKITIAGAGGEDVGVAGQVTTLKGQLNVDQAATFDANVTIAGNLDVNGTTTTIDTTNMTVQDSIIGLGISGADGSFNNAGDRAILFARGANSFDPLATLWYDGANFALAKTLTAPASGTVGSVSSYLDLKLGRVGLDNNADSDYSLMLDWNEDEDSANRALAFKVNAGDRTIDLSGNLTVEGASIINQDLSTDSATVAFAGLSLSDGNITNVGDINADSVSVDDAAVGLDIDGSGANTGLFKLSMGDNLASGLDIHQGGTSYMRFDTTDDAEQVELGKKLFLNAGVPLHFGSSTDKIDVGGSNDMTVTAASVILSGTSEVYFVDGYEQGALTDSKGLPLANAADEWSSFVTNFGAGSSLVNAINNLKTQAKSLTHVSSSVSADTAFVIGLDNANAFDLSGTDWGDVVKSVDVYVNGQLMSSGTLAQVTAGDRDYVISTKSAASEFKFGFALQGGDVVAATKR
jgi:hypothetical protein